MLARTGRWLLFAQELDRVLRKVARFDSQNLQYVAKNIRFDKTIVFPNSSTDHGFLFKMVFCRSEIPVSNNKVRFMRSW